MVILIPFFFLIEGSLSRKPKWPKDPTKMLEEQSGRTIEHSCGKKHRTTILFYPGINPFNSSEGEKLQKHCTNLVILDTERTRMTGTTNIDEVRARSVSVVDGGVINCDSCSKVEEVEYCCAGNRGRYTGEINEKGKPHGNGSFVREGDGGTPMIYVGTWRHGERVGEGRYYTNGRLLGNVVWD
jgi:hypothetical protein